MRKNRLTAARLLEALKDFAQRLLLYPNEAARIKQEWFAEVEACFGKPGADFAMCALAIAQERSSPNTLINHLELKAVSVDRSKNKRTIRAGGDVTNVKQKAGRDMVGVTGGSKNWVEMDVNAYAKAMDREQSVNVKLRKALKDGRLAVEEMKLDDAEKAELLSAYGKLTTEATKSEPKKNLLKSAWNTVITLASNVKPLVELGTLLTNTFGISGLLPPPGG